MKDKNFKKAVFAGIAAMVGYALLGPIGAIAGAAIFCVLS